MVCTNKISFYLTESTVVRSADRGFCCGLRVSSLGQKKKEISKINIIWRILNEWTNMGDK